MQIIKDYPFEKQIEYTSAALGFFDGVHIAHRKIIENAVNSPYLSVVITFDKHPLSLIDHRQTPKGLITEEERNRILDEMGVDILYILPFDEKMMNMEPVDFIENILLKLNIKEVNAGFNYTFGCKGKGNIALLKNFGEKYGFKVNTFEAIQDDEKIISSTLIRKMLIEGNISEANKYLGRRYFLEGKVVKGRQVGRTISIPTINIFPDKNMIIPKNGVYITKTKVNSKYYYGITNIGENPTFEGLNLRCETNLFDFNEDIYGNQIRIEFEEFIRGEIKFDSVEALKNEINSNIVFAKEYIKKNQF